MVACIKKTSQLCFLQVNMQHFSVPLLHHLHLMGLLPIHYAASWQAVHHPQEFITALAHLTSPGCLSKKLYHTGSGLLSLFCSRVETEVVLPGSCN